jgi:valyl-tRNA synthetase
MAIEKTHYDHNRVETDIRKRWASEEGQTSSRTNPDAPANPNAEPPRNFCVMLPPPNVTGALHMGHALNSTLQDILMRWRRMCGDDVLWQPGVDHAGIATQMVVTRELEKEHGVGCVSGMDRDTFLSHVWAWKKKSGNRIKEQLDRLGASCNWERERFTMDEEFSHAVRHAFVTLYRDKLIFRDYRLVNWDPYFRTAISDLEVVSKPIQGTLWYFRYPIEGCEQTITVATTRPETIPGDTGIAVHPDDKRYSGLIGKFAILPMVGRRIPIVADDHVDQTLGTGAVKITPAHDMDDFQIGKRHKLRSINIMDVSAHIQLAGNEDFLEGLPEGSSREVAATIAALDGLDRFAARDWIVKHCGETGILEKAVGHEHMVPFGDRSGVPLEPYLTYQWFVDTADMAKKAIEVVEDETIGLYPDSWKNTYLRWLENIEPWCISRQLIWGHRIPLWYAEDGTVFCGMTEEEALKEAEKHFGHPVELTQDADVLDTWFSSALWPFATLGWPKKTPELEKFFPTTVLVTGFDIIFFWVARMVMFSLYFMKDQNGKAICPFHEVYVHALARDENGQKMSKSLGNVIDPMDLCDKYGADSVRFTLASMAAMGRDIKLSESRIEGYRNFCTKLWNATRFCIMNEAFPEQEFDPHTVKHPINKWFVGKAACTVEYVELELEARRFNRAANRIYSYVWGEFCDQYLEFSKTIFTKGTPDEQKETKACVGWAIEQIFMILHPFMPFATQELWERLQERDGKDSGHEKRIFSPVWPSSSAEKSRSEHLEQDQEQKQDNLSEKREMQEQVLESRCRVLGEDHPDTLAIMNNLALMLYAQGELSKAQKMQEKVLESSHRVLGEDHPDTLRSMNNLAGTLEAQGNLSEALEMQEQVLESSRRVLGEDHPDTLTFMNNLAETLHAQGNLLDHAASTLGYS